VPGEGVPGVGVDFPADSDRRERAVTVRFLPATRSLTETRAVLAAAILLRRAPVIFELRQVDRAALPPAFFSVTEVLPNLTLARSCR